mmetsp:Transcript_51312/g.120207  ORF Transcript_51312/g.120207 Transcript_51312/m.120207 type:complete len:129 (-) Transcript_51312:69-455(-)
MQLRMSTGLLLLVTSTGITWHVQALSHNSSPEVKLQPSGTAAAQWSLLRVVEQKARSWFPDIAVEEGARTVVHPKKPGAANSADAVKEVVTPSPGFFKPFLSLLLGIVCLAAVWAWNHATLKAARSAM